MTVQLSDLLLTFPMEQAYAGILEIAEETGLRLAGARLVHAHLVLEGKVTLRCETESYEVETGDFVLLPHGIDYQLACGTRPNYVQQPRRDRAGMREDGLRHYRLGAGARGALLLSSTMGNELSSPRAAASVLPSVVHLHQSQIPLTKPAPSADGQLLSNLCSGAGGRAFAAAVFNLLYVHTLRICYAELNPNESMETYLRHRHLGVEAALRLVQKNVGFNWTVASLAAAVGMSRSAFAMAFRMAVGESPLAYLTRLRLERAASMLTSDEPRSVAEIAESVGYRSHAAFDRAFKSRYFKAPRCYRAGP